MKDLTTLQGSGEPGSPGSGRPDTSNPAVPSLPADTAAEATTRIDRRIDSGAVELSDSEQTQVIDVTAAQTAMSQDDSPTVVVGLASPQGASGGGASEPDSRGGRSRGLIGAVVAGAVLAVLAVVYVIDLLATGGAIERNTTIAGVDVGGLTPEQATSALATRALPGYAQTMTVDVHGVPTPITPAEAGLTADVAATVQAVGTRSANPFARLTSFFVTTDHPLSVHVDKAALTTVVTAIAMKTDLQPVEGEVALDGVAVRTVEPVIGRSLEVPESVTAVSDAWATGGPASLEGLVLPVTSSPVRATPEKVQAAAAEATALLAAPLVLTGPESSVEVSVPSIAEATRIVADGSDGFTVGVDVPALRAKYTEAIEGTQTGAADATIAIVNDKPVVKPSTPGRTVDWDTTLAAIGPALRSTHTAPIAYVVAEPSLTTEKVQALGINEIIGEFTTGGFASASGENIRVVAEKVNGAIVQPGATFGLNEFTGHRGSEQGYVPAAIIQEGALSKAVGGGISQFATTLFNAAYFAGMGDVTHTPHSFYISRYPAGREATVFDGEIELAFSNDYPTGVYIETIWTDSDITVRLWGTKHVQVESQTSDRFNYTSPQVVVKPYGEACSPSGGTSGFSVVNTRIVKDLSGKEIRREDFTTVYNGQQNVICSPPPARDPAPATRAQAQPSAAASTPTPPPSDAAAPPAADPAPSGG